MIRLRLASMAVGVLLSACVTYAPEGVAPPEATEASADPIRISLPPDRQLISLRITVEEPPSELLDPQGAGVITLVRGNGGAPRHLVFINGALGVYALEPGGWRIASIAGHDCGALEVVLRSGAAPVALGDLQLRPVGEAATLSGSPPTPEDLTQISGLIESNPAALDARPLVRGTRRCGFKPNAVSRPDIDPTVPEVTPLEIAGGVLLFAILGAATGGALAASSGTFVFTSGSAGGLLLVGL